MFRNLGFQLAASGGWSNVKLEPTASIAISHAMVGFLKCGRARNVSGCVFIIEDTRYGEVRGCERADLDLITVGHLFTCES